MGQASWSSPHAWTHRGQSHTSGRSCLHTGSARCFYGWELQAAASAGQHQEQKGGCTFPILPTPQRPRGSLSKKPMVLPEKNPSLPPSRVTLAAPCRSPKPSWAAGQDFGVLHPALPAQVRSGLPAGLSHPPPHTAAMHVPQDSSPPCPSDGLMLYPYTNPSMFLSKSKAWSTWGPCSTSAGGAALQGGHRQGYGFPGKPTPPSLWISCGFVVSPSVNMPFGISR